MRPSPTSLYGLIIQAPLMSHFIASYTRAGVFCCLKAVLSRSKPTAWHPHIPHTSACLPAGHQQLAASTTEFQLTPPRRRTWNNR
ncbi:hypothetical protein BgiBS90_037820 [Biomphalaria glabrata]|nr:hypothetical protein BgiBS90_038128 [Biomphalaria glabrata]KAI8728139.1 hypothetical protein BgiBS90_038060 [Biomphalaria glabrata]KAI8729621.1 hypothetical protein BgiBS90_037820 [Biomphalaria glabrata]